MKSAVTPLLLTPFVPFRQPVELVEAAPGAARGEALEGARHGHVVHLRGRVDDVARARQRVGEVLRALGLAGAGGTLRRAAHGEVQRLRRRDVDPVRQRRHDEPRAVAQVLVRVPDPGVADLHLRVALVLDPVAPQHALPLEGVGPVVLYYYTIICVILLYYYYY